MYFVCLSSWGRYIYIMLYSQQNDPGTMLRRPTRSPDYWCYPACRGCTKACHPPREAGYNCPNPAPISGPRVWFLPTQAVLKNTAELPAQHGDLSSPYTDSHSHNRIHRAYPQSLEPTVFNDQLNEAVRSIPCLGEDLFHLCCGWWDRAKTQISNTKSDHTSRRKQ